MILLLVPLWCLGASVAALGAVALRSRRSVPAASVIGGLAYMDVVLALGGLT